jgi:hypothetical protein
VWTAASKVDIIIYSLRERFKRRKADQFRGGDMTLQTFRNLLTQRPFQPFRLIMSSGENYDVRHPEMAMLTQSDILVGTDVRDDGVPAEFKICALLHVATIEPISSASARKNGNNHPE